MDRKVALEQVQIQFLDDICLSLYKDMSRFSSALEPLLEGCLANRQRWINLKSNSQADSETGEEHARNLWAFKKQKKNPSLYFSNDFHYYFETSDRRINRCLYKDWFGYLLSLIIMTLY